MSTLSPSSIIALLLLIIIPIVIYTIFFLKRPNQTLTSPQPSTVLPDTSINPDLATVVMVAEISGGECPVCLSSFANEEELWRLNLCSHIFHAPCIERWLDAHSDCPVCRAYVKTQPKPSILLVARDSTHHRDDHWQGMPDSAGLL